jgi:hypothetical protein
MDATECLYTLTQIRILKIFARGPKICAIRIFEECCRRILPLGFRGFSKSDLNNVVQLRPLCVSEIS